jgi:hypothetical protein
MFFDHHRDEPESPCSSATGVPEPERVSRSECGGKSLREACTDLLSNHGTANNVSSVILSRRSAAKDLNAAFAATKPARLPPSF